MNMYDGLDVLLVPCRCGQVHKLTCGWMHSVETEAGHGPDAMYPIEWDTDCPWKEENL